MKSYPSIPTKINFKHTYVLFDKLDGSNIRVEWSEKKGFYKFGSRNQLLTEQQKTLYPSIEVIKEKYEEAIDTAFRRMRAQSGICFFEYFGPNSFAGNHSDPVEKMDAVLFDVNPYKKGILPPEQFLKFSEGMETPKILFEGKLNQEIITSIREHTLEGITLEGVVAKAKGIRHNGMTKIKTRKWLDKLKEFCNNDPVLFNRLK